MRQYNSFKEIDRDLQLLRLQKEVEKERVILSFNLTKESASPKSLFKSLASGVFKSTIILKGTTKVLGYIGRKW
ncbi:MAG TPA: DUF6327 family protein [Salinimicrobium sp.]|nr:DUF6327 family protein [Salinimicrobium sp.]